MQYFFLILLKIFGLKKCLLYERRSPTCDLVKATSVHLFADEKMTKPATAYEGFDEAFWNNDAATVIRDEPSDKLSESRNSFRWPRPASPRGGTESFVPMWKMHGVRYSKRGRLFSRMQRKALPRAPRTRGRQCTHPEPLLR
jgi:hypothetical protein